MNYYYESLKKRVSQIQSEFELSKNIVHNASKGTYREVIIHKLLRPFLPYCYGISGGEAFDLKGIVSKQLDCVIYDSLYSYIIPFSDHFVQFPCESVFGNIEIKTHLNSVTLEESIENIASLKKLYRASIQNFQINPMLELKINTIHWNIADAMNEIFGIIFAYESSSTKTILENLHALSSKYRREYLPNMIVLFNEKTIITRYQYLANEKYTLHPLGDFNGFCAVDYKDDILANFVIVLLIILRCIQLKTMDIEELQNDIQTEALKKYISTIPNIIVNR